MTLSETGGCRDCGGNNFVAPILRDELQQQYQRKYGQTATFNVRWAAPKLPSDYTSEPAIIYGSNWVADPERDYIGADLPSAGNANNRYGYIRLKHPNGVGGWEYVDFYLVHLAPGNDHPSAVQRDVQMSYLLSVVEARKSEVRDSIIAGDFNASLDHVILRDAGDASDQHWMGLVNHQGYWVSGHAPCSYYKDGATPTDSLFFGPDNHVIGAIELGTPQTTPLLPFAYPFQGTADGDPKSGTSEPIDVQGIAHGVVGVLFK